MEPQTIKDDGLPSVVELEYWQVLESLIFPVGEGVHASYLCSKGGNQTFMVSVSLFDKLGLLGTWRDIEVTQYIFKSGYGGDYNAMKLAREYARRWLTEILTIEQNAKASRSLPFLE